MNPATVVAFVALAVGFLALGAVVSWQIVRGDTRADQLVKERADHLATQVKLERALFDLDKAQKALDAANQRIATFTSAAEKRVDEPVNADLASDDLDTRRVRAAIKAKAAAARGASPVPGDAHESVRPQADPARPDPAKVQPAGSLDPNEVLR